MRSVNLKGKKRKSETNGSEGDHEENGGTVSPNTTDTSCVDEVKEPDNNNMTKGKKRGRSSKSINEKSIDDENKNENHDNDDHLSTTSDEHDNSDVKSNKRRKKETNNKPTTSQDDDGADDDADVSKEHNNEVEETKIKEKEKSNEETDAEEYEVERIVDARTIKGKRQFLVRWKGYSEDSDTWEGEDGLRCPRLIEEYLEAENDEENIEAEKKVTPSKAKKLKKKVPKGKKKTTKTSKSPKNGKNVKQTKNNDVGDDDDDETEEKDDKNSKKEYEVEKILDVYFKKNKEKEFLIRWKGFSSKDDTWEPEKNLNCSKLIEAFMGKLDKAKSVDPRELRTNPKHTKRYTLATTDHGRRLSRRNVNKQRTTYYQCDE
ncbi:hypothetical protein HCN44_006575 [Aphidius gifuensis]|uniref:Chromo domain-containing protein n=1 Tax=Aphidius gifuensis TaxID=684658 RepID=A0A834Y0E1_APHGI|nr:chromodomain-helicase-DNA-binding protein 1-like [Aphidius gifuensis]KAF7995468.1 hypothetical protein HCN44_006575 [Aphidius gifuensis]